jgi:hypothetical protein
MGTSRELHIRHYRNSNPNRVYGVCRRYQCGCHKVSADYRANAHPDTHSNTRANTDSDPILTSWRVWRIHVDQWPYFSITPNQEDTSYARPTP